MGRAFLVIGLVLGFTSPAQAARVWSPPVALATPQPSVADAAVAPDGARLTAWETDPYMADDTVVARVGDAPPVTLATGAGFAVRVATTPDGGGLVVWSTLSPTQTYAATASADGTFSAPALIGDGYLGALATNAAGDAAVLLAQGRVDDPQGTTTAFRPAGGAFGAPVNLGIVGPASLALDAAGATVVGSAGAAAVQIYSRVRDGAVSGPQVFATEAPSWPVSLAADDHGRVLAAWSTKGTVTTTVRDAAGAWAAPAGIASSDAEGPVAAVDGAGDAVVAWQDGSVPVSDRALHAVSGSLAGGFGAPQVLDSGDGRAITIGMGPDGTAVIVHLDTYDQVVSVVRRDGTGPFTAAQVVACRTSALPPTLAGVTSGGRATLLVNGTLTTDAPADTAAPEHTCPVLESGRTPTVTYSSDPVIAGASVTLTPDIRQANHDVTSQSLTFESGQTEPVAPGGSITHTFPSPGLNTFVVHSAQTSQYDGVSADISRTFVVDVRALPTLAVRRVARRWVLVRANAFAGAGPLPVRIVLRSRGHVLGHLSTELTSRAEVVRVPFDPGTARHRLARINVYLRQGGRREAAASVGARVSSLR